MVDEPYKVYFQVQFRSVRVIRFLLRITKILSSRATLQDLHQKTKIEEKAKTSSSKRQEAGHLQKMIGVYTHWNNFSRYGSSFLLILMFEKDVWEIDKQPDLD